MVFFQPTFSGKQSSFKILNLFIFALHLIPGKSDFMLRCHAKFILLSWLCFLPGWIFAQETGSKSFFDRVGNACSETSAYYYRVKTAEPDSFKSYYANGEALFFSGRILKIHPAREDSNVYIGTCNWFFRNGNKKSSRNFNEKGLENGVSKYYFESGGLESEQSFVNGTRSSNHNEYYEDGSRTRIFEESFSDNQNDWEVYTSDHSISEISGGKFKISSLGPEGTSRVISYPVEKGNFVIEAKLSFPEISDKQKGGIIFGFKDWQNYNFLFLSGRSLLYGTVYEGFTEMETRGIANPPKSKSELVTLKILGSSDRFMFSYNSEVSFVSNKYRFYGNKIGFGISGSATMEVENLMIKEMDVRGSMAALPAKETDRNIKSYGSGIFISGNGLIATNHHVVKGSNFILVEVKDGKNGILNYSAKVVQTDQENDLAIIKIDDPAFKGLDSICYSFKPGGTVEVGTSVFTLGFPLALSGMGKEIKFTDGKVSSKTGYNNSINSYQTTIPVQPGNSGGPVFNDKGQLVGIIHATVSGTDNVSYAVKMNFLLNLLEVLPDHVSPPMTDALQDKTLEEKIKVLSEYVVLIKLRE